MSTNPHSFPFILWAQDVNFSYILRKATKSIPHILNKQELAKGYYVFFLRGEGVWKHRSTDKKICKKTDIFQQHTTRAQSPLDDLCLLDTSEKHECFQVEK